MRVTDRDLTIISRNQWKAVPAKSTQQISPANLPVPFVVIHHSAVNNNCSGLPCSQIVRNYQLYHMETKGWSDIGYNMLVAPNGDIFEGRGWDIVGAHARGKNQNSIGICLIGNFEEITPTEEALSSLHNLVQFGVSKGSISNNYTMIGHNQVRSTLCPGKNLLSVIRTWPHWNSLL